MNDLQRARGVGPKGSALALDPRQMRFIGFYTDVSSPTFSNCYQSAIKAGFSEETAQNLTHNRPKWLSESLGQINVLEPEQILAKLTDIVNDANELTVNRLRAIDMLMKYNRMYLPEVPNNIQVNIQNILE